MRRRKRLVKIILPSLGIAALILDSNTAIKAAAEGIGLCIRTVIPSLFPFFLLSILLTNAMAGIDIPILRPLGKLCRIPKGTENLFLIGLLGGYPTGAQAITERYQRGQLSKSCAERLLGFCNNAGPAFIFGIMGGLFTSKLMPWLLWIVHILSAIFTGMLVPGEQKPVSGKSYSERCDIHSAFKKALFAIASVCGWIILFRVMLAFLQRWFLWLLPEIASITVIGIFELANGVFALQKIDKEGLRFILGSFFLSFGGLCVGMQTVSATAGIGTGWYFPGKIIQSIFSFTLASIVSLILIEPLPYLPSIISIGISLSVMVMLIFRQCKITVAFSHNWVYNTQKQTKELR